jgi:transposase
MYLRTTRRKNADGSTVEYHQLAENVWDAEKGCAVAKVVYNFGRADQLDAVAMRRLARSILRVLPGEVAVTAEPGVAVLDSWPYGTVHVVQSIWHELGIDGVIGELQAKHGERRQPFERALFAMVANRTSKPCSKLYCRQQWLPEEVFLPGKEKLELQHLYRAMDFLEAHKAHVEREVFFHMADLMNADVDVIFYDTTSLHFEIDEEDSAPRLGNKLAGRQKYEALRKRGHSKNGRSDVPQLVVGLAVTRDGLPVRSWVFPGNTVDVTTVEKVKQDLRGWRLGRCVFVGDAGMNSEENRRTLALGAGKYILAARMRAGDEVTKEVVTRGGRYQIVGDNLRIKAVLVGDGTRQRRYVVCFNPVEAERQRQHRQMVLEELAAELKTLRKPGRGEGHSKRTCELLSTPRFARYLRQAPWGGLKIDLSAVRREKKLDGKWVITSNDDTLSAEDLALGYKQLMRVEQCWHTVKGGLRTRPIFHWTPHRICAHVSLCVLALLVERIAEIRAKDTWRNIRDQLETIKVIEYERGGVHVQQTTEIRPAVAALLARLKIELPPKIHGVTPGKTATPTQAGATET